MRWLAVLGVALAALLAPAAVSTAGDADADVGKMLLSVRHAGKGVTPVGKSYTLVARLQRWKGPDWPRLNGKYVDETGRPKVEFQQKFNNGYAGMEPVAAYPAKFRFKCNRKQTVRWRAQLRDSYLNVLRTTKVIAVRCG